VNAEGTVRASSWKRWRLAFRDRQYLERDIDFGESEASLAIEVSPPEPVALVRESEETGNGWGRGRRGRYPATEDETRTTTRVEKQM